MCADFQAALCLHMLVYFSQKQAHIVTFLCNSPLFHHTSQTKFHAVKHPVDYHFNNNFFCCYLGQILFYSFSITRLNLVFNSHELLEMFSNASGVLLIRDLAGSVVRVPA